jgi:hypothetical protein
MRVFTFVSQLMLLSCGNNIPFQEVAELKRPVGLQVSPNNGLSFTLSLYVQNQEEIFDGYNLLISRSSIPDGSTSPVIIDGTLPTFKYGPEDFNVITAKTISINTFDGFRSFESGVTYFFRVCAHSRTGRVSELSNEVSAEAIL